MTQADRCILREVAGRDAHGQWEGVVVFKVGGKMFCLIAPPDHR
jgi:hypothetical protein